MGAELERFASRSRLREPVPVARSGALMVERNGQRLVSFSSNDYLGLSVHPALADAAHRAMGKGCGSGASRLLGGGSPEVHRLEERLARFKQTEAALIFANGYMANIGVIAALAGRRDALFCDRLNHASIWDGARLSGASLYRYRHGDVAQLEQLLRDATGARRKLIVTETLFGMDGDVAPLEQIVRLSKRHGAALMVDEAHAGGVFGPRGEGLAYREGVQDVVDLHMGTFGKAFGSYGAYVAGRRSWIDYLVNTCRTFIYTTALPPPAVGALAASIELVEQAGEARVRLLAMAERLRSGLAGLGLTTGASASQIVPLIVGDAAAAMHAAAALEQRGILAALVRPPVVPEGTSRLRFSVTAAHHESHIDQVLEAVGGLAGRVRRIT
ncbi:MAG: 8-amino-7-oxononanoate synthase [Actinomycetota bacterium]